MCIGEGGRNMSVLRWEPRMECGLYETENEIEKLRVGPGLRVCEAGYETNNFGKLQKKGE